MRKFADLVDSDPRLEDGYVQIDRGLGVRIYVKRFQNQPGGRFVVVEVVQGPSHRVGEDPHVDMWSHDAMVEVVCDGTAYFDGIRHLYWRPDVARGYDYYPDLEMLGDVLLELGRLFPDHDSSGRG